MKYIKTLLVFSVMLFFLTSVPNTLCGQNSAKDKVIAKIKIIIGKDEIEGVVYDSAQGRDFLSLLPSTQAFEDFNQSEKISYLNKKLSVDRSYKSTNPSIGDITYYIPWGNIAIFYKNFNYSENLIKIGRIEKGLDKLTNMKGKFNARIEITEK